MTFHLVFIKGPDQGRTVTVDSGQRLTLGRGDECNVQINDPHVSRLHCRLEVGNDTARLVDTGSTWGTLVNGKKTSERKLKSGDVIEIGETRIRFGSDTSSTASTLGPQGVDRKDTGAKPRQTGQGPIPAAGNLEQLPGTTLLRYEIGDPIAKGASGMVFRAVDTKHERPVALKVLWPELTRDENEVQRFVRAIKTMLPIKHPNLVRLYGAGVTEPYCWMAMELVEGESLADVIERIGIGGMLTWQEVLRPAYHIAGALEVAHEHQIVHRNITPQNILIRSSDKVAKLGDLMLAKALEGSMAESITKAGEILGELAYLSPEQTTGDPHIDCRSDIYSLGATLYRLVSGRPPFEGRNPAEIIRKIQNDEPEKPRVHHLAIPPMFEGIIMKMIAKDPEQRFSTSTQLIKELKRFAQYQGLPEP